MQDRVPDAAGELSTASLAVTESIVFLDRKDLIASIYPTIDIRADLSRVILLWEDYLVIIPLFYFAFCHGHILQKLRSPSLPIQCQLAR